MVARSFRGIAVLLAGVALAASCGDIELGLPGFGGQNALPPQSITIQIPANAESQGSKAFGDNPKQLVQGSTVTWTNGDSVPQSVTAVNGEFDSGELAPGASFSQTFANVAVIPYYSKPHPNVSGTLNVIGSSSTPLPQASFSPVVPTPTVSPITVPSPFVSAPVLPAGAY